MAGQTEKTREGRGRAVQRKLSCSEGAAYKRSSYKRDCWYPKNRVRLSEGDTVRASKSRATTMPQAKTKMLETNKEKEAGQEAGSERKLRERIVKRVVEGEEGYIDENCCSVLELR